MSILYVSSFAKDMYDTTGKRLVDSYIKYQSDPNQNLLICYENFDFDITISNKILSYPLHESIFLNNWLEKNKDIIPECIGGLATEKTDPNVFKSLWNKKASRWFRKIAALEYAYRTYNDKYKYIIWLDSDCYFTNKVSNDFIMNLFLRKGVIYHLGKWRNAKKTGIESGIIGFQLYFGGFPLLEQVFKCFETGDFRKYERWDDGYIFKMILVSHNKNPKKYIAYDLVTNPKALGTVIPFSPFANYMKHDKGLHAKSGIGYIKLS